MAAATTQTRAGVPVTSLDSELFDGAGATKRDLLDYLEAVAPFLLPELTGRPLSVIRVRPGQQPFMQKNLPASAPDWIPRVPIWAEASHREVSYALCEETRTLVWFGNQRAVEYHPTLHRRGADDASVLDRLVVDLDPPEGSDAFAAAAAVALVVREVLSGCGLAGAVKTSGSKGVHVVVPLAGGDPADAAAATRALAARTAALDPDRATVEYVKADRGGRVFVDSTRAGGATVVAAWSPRIRPGTPVSWPLAWDELTDVHPSDFTLRAVTARLGTDRWAELPDPQQLPANLVAEGHDIPVARVAAMHEGRRRARRRRETDDTD
ncbi:ATP-dependent DNA ligase [Desertihabitans brevis]|uniref:ATP-dependent DNA ligase n=1 Tax=Desertihabitans brevis TaxID=2268447 RepID=A0A367YVV2_9ACTN|nr:ATP-dependent DNA ligase [Desertihabitans brevis]RCK69930.1 ATP-dependent DNA ligase [Desertihabitans brevis]